MNKRLEHIYSKIKPGKGVIDVGTDHGYIPVQLALDGYSGSIFASDINQMPLNTALNNAEDAGVTERISFILYDGISPECMIQSDTVIIAGMGGDTICHILDDAYEQIENNVTFILQPMSKAEILRYWLVNNGFSIYEESLVYENARLYPVISARLTGINSSLRDFELYTGSVGLISGSIYYKDVLSIYIKKFKKICGGKSSTDYFGGTILNELMELWGKEI